MIEVPIGAIMFDEGSFYKFGSKGLPFYYNSNGDWVKSDKTPEFLKARFKKRKGLDASDGISVFSHIGSRKKL